MQLVVGWLGLVGLWTPRELVILRRVVRGVWACDAIRLELIGVLDSDNPRMGGQCCQFKT
jgi:hypothetical protein